MYTHTHTHTHTHTKSMGFEMQRVVKPKTKVFRIRAAQLIMIAE